MNWHLPLLAGCMLTTVGITSCSLPGGGSSGLTISRPTVTEMDALESQWGTKPKAAASPAPLVLGGVPPAPSTAAPVTPASIPAPAPAAPVALPTTIDISTPQSAAPAPVPAIPPTLR